ncbi:MAG: hypothetical protein H6704_15290 [Myxococcales bacterium]|nr:hypothetical protein [Myxococcales bacterium]
MTARGAARLLVCLLLLAGAGAARAAPRVVDVDFRGPVGPDVARMKAQTFFLLNGSPSADRLADAVRSLEQVEGVGGVDVEISEVEGDDARVVFVYDGLVRRVAALDCVRPGAAAEWGERLIRRLQPVLRLRPGERFHPYLLALDREALLDFFRRRGYREAEVEGSTEQLEDLVRVVWRVERGVQDRVGAVDIEGGTFDAPERATLREGLALQPGVPLDPEIADRDAERIRLRQCRRGHPEAGVTITESEEGPVQTSDEGPRRPMRVAFVVEAGPRVRTGRVQVAGRYVPWAVISALPLRDEMPFCEDLLDAAVADLEAWLRDNGVLDPQVVVHRDTTQWTDGSQSLALTLEITSPRDARIERIWYTGHRVTDRAVLEQLTEVKVGDLYRESEVQATVQSMRRSGLFRRVEAHAEPGARPGTAYVSFHVDEREPIGFDVGSQRLILRNVDLTRWPEDWDDFEHGPALRGGGQRLDIYGQTNRQGIEWRNPFVARHVLAQVRVNRFDTAGDTYEDVFYQLFAGLGAKALANRFVALPFVQAEWVFASQDDAGPPLPILDTDAFTVAGGLQVSLDANQLDDERIPYLGFDVSGLALGGGAVDADLRWIEYSTEARVHLPLWTTAREQHWVLRLRAAMSQAFEIDGSLPPHRRFFPEARGYTGTALGVVFDRGALDEKLGSTGAVEGSAELRVPLPVGRRNAVVPFVDVIGVSPDTRGLLDDLYPAAGALLTLSLFDERLEFSIWGAWPLRDEISARYVGASLGGGF